MPPAPRPADESARLAALRDLAILDTPPDPAFDALVRAASLALDAPISLISLIDEHRQWFKANVGLSEASETPREQAFCAHAILGDAMLEVPDATGDTRFSDNPLVTGGPKIRFYAGMPLRLGDGSRVGTLCVIDRVPRAMTDRQREILRCLALAAGNALETWRVQALRRRAEQALFEERQRLANIIDATEIGTWEWQVQTGELRLNGRWAEILGRTLAEMAPISIQTRLDLVHPEDLPRSLRLLEDHFAGRTALYEVESRMRHRDGHFVWVLSRGKVITRTADGRPEWMYGKIRDITDRKRQEEALRKTQGFLERAGRLAGVGGWELDLLTGQTHWSAETSRIHGVPVGYQPTTEEAIGFLAPEARPLIRDALDRAAAGGDPWDLELPLNTEDGRRIWVRTVGSATFADGRPVRLTGAIQDITAQVRERDALRAAHERIALATDNGRIGIWDWDLTNDRTVWDAWMYRLHGMTPMEGSLAPGTWETLVHPDDLPAAKLALRDALAGTEPFDTEFRVVWPDGSVHRLRANGRVTRDARGRAVRMVGVNVDVTEQRRLAAELVRQAERQAEAAEREAAVFRGSPDALFIVGVEETPDGPAFRYEAFNPACQAMTTLPVARMIGKRPHECLPDAWARQAETHYRRVLADDAPFNYAATYPMPEGPREMEGLVSPVRDPRTGRIVRIVGWTRDVTERNRAREAIQQDQKMAAIGRLAAGVAHDFNNILQSITGGLELVLDAVKPGTKEAEFLAIGLRAARRGSYLTFHLLAFARQQVLLPRDVAVGQILSDIAILLGRTLGSRIAITTHCDPAVTGVRVDPGQLQTALLNLSINAAHAMPEGGALRLEARLEGEAELTWVVVSVTDTGTGMDEATLAKAAEPFFTTKGLEGMGLGLSMVKGFAEQSGGRFRIRSVLGEGTTIDLLLPAATLAAPPEAAAPVVVERRPGSGNVLLVDDDADVRVTTAAFLAKAGFTALQARNANEALELLAGNARVDAIVSDFAMPGMNGLDLVAEARLQRPDLAAIIISGFIDTREGAALDEGTVRLHKPFQRGALIAVLRQLLDAGQGRAQPPDAVAPMATQK